MEIPEETNTEYTDPKKWAELLDQSDADKAAMIPVLIPIGNDWHSKINMPDDFPCLYKQTEN